MDKKQKRNVLIFLGAFLVATAWLLLLALQTKAALNHSDIELALHNFSELQKKLEVYNLVIYAVLLSFGMYLFATLKRLNYALLALVLFIAFTLYNHVSLSKQAFALQNINPSESGNYWLLVFIGVFYVLGAVVVAAIGYLVLKNYAKRYLEESDQKVR